MYLEIFSEKEIERAGRFGRAGKAGAIVGRVGAYKINVKKFVCFVFLL